VIGHFAEVEEEVDRPLELDREIDGVLELLVIGKTELGIDRDFDALRLFFDDYHGRLRFLLSQFSTSPARQVCGASAWRPGPCSKRPAVRYVASRRRSDTTGGYRQLIEHPAQKVFHLTGSPLIGYFRQFDSSLYNATNKLEASCRRRSRGHDSNRHG
jgi:hypothetical protein